MKRPAYSEQGWASYIADSYEGRPTSSGAFYDPRAYTAAHNTLPFGTVVTVKNQQNGQKVDVVVNDRFPNYPGRGGHGHWHSAFPTRPCRSLCSGDWPSRWGHERDAGIRRRLCALRRDGSAASGAAGPTQLHPPNHGSDLWWKQFRSTAACDGWLQSRHSSVDVPASPHLRAAAFINPQLRSPRRRGSSSGGIWPGLSAGWRPGPLISTNPAAPASWHGPLRDQSAAQRDGGLRAGPSRFR